MECSTSFLYAEPAAKRKCADTAECVVQGEKKKGRPRHSSMSTKKVNEVYYNWGMCQRVQFC